MEGTMEKAMIASMLLMMLFRTTLGHGMMIDPPQRSSMWRFGYTDSPKNYDDNELFCGGFERQWKDNNGKCGVCGDAYDDPEPENAAGGKYATGVIVRTYEQGEVIDVSVNLTANHLGYFLFKLCPNNNVTKRVTHECLNQHVLRVVGLHGQDLGEKYYVDSQANLKQVRLKLPYDVICTQCVLQWTYHGGNSWGCNEDDLTNCCVGCGPQENFVNCADIAITGSGDSPASLAPTRPPVTTPPPTTTAKPASTTSANQGESGGCHAVGAFANVSGMDAWCDNNCSMGSQFCPASHCSCP